MNKAILSSLYYFTNQDIGKFTKEQNANVYIFRYAKNNDIVRLKRGLYVTRDKIHQLEKTQNMDFYLKYICTNLIIAPSYLSCEYVLFNYNIITENVYNFTAITTKKTNTITNQFGIFLYKNIDDKLFWGYEIKKSGDLFYFQAYPEKALLDWLWLRNDIVFDQTYFEELRLNIHNLNFDRLSDFVLKFDKKKITKAFLFLQKLKGL